MVLIVLLVLVFIAAAVLLVNSTQRYIKEKLEESLGKDFSVRAVALGIRSFDFMDVRIKDPSGREALYIPEVSCSFRVFDLLTGRKVIRRLEIRQPQMLLAIDPKGRLTGPVPALPAGGEKDKRSPPWVLETVAISKGSIDFVDRREPQRPVRIRIESLNLSFHHIVIPVDGRETLYELTAAVSGRTINGKLQSRGQVNFGKGDAECSLKLANLDMTGLEPYYQQGYHVSLRKGYLDLDMDAKVTGGRIRADGRAVLKDLTLKSNNGIGSRFMGIPLSLLAVFLERNDHKIPVRFQLEGDLKNPAFSLRENLVQGMASGMAETVGYVLQLPGKAASGSGLQTLKSKVGRWGGRIKKSLSP